MVSNCNCVLPIPDHAKFCPYCGNDLPDKRIYCRNCNNEIEDDWNRCIECGILTPTGLKLQQQHEAEMRRKEFERNQAAQREFRERERKAKVLKELEEKNRRRIVEENLLQDIDNRLREIIEKSMDSGMHLDIDLMKVAEKNGRLHQIGEALVRTLKVLLEQGLICPGPFVTDHFSPETTRMYRSLRASLDLYHYLSNSVIDVMRCSAVDKGGGATYYFPDVPSTRSNTYRISPEFIHICDQLEFDWSCCNYSFVATLFPDFAYYIDRGEWMDWMLRGLFPTLDSDEFMGRPICSKCGDYGSEHDEYSFWCDWCEHEIDEDGNCLVFNGGNEGEYCETCHYCDYCGGVGCEEIWDSEQECYCFEYNNKQRTKQDWYDSWEDHKYRFRLDMLACFVSNFPLFSVTDIYEETDSWGNFCENVNYRLVEGEHEVYCIDSYEDDGWEDFSGTRQEAELWSCLDEESKLKENSDCFGDPFKYPILTILRSAVTLGRLRKEEGSAEFKEILEIDESLFSRWGHNGFEPITDQPPFDFGEGRGMFLGSWLCEE